VCWTRISRIYFKFDMTINQILYLIKWETWKGLRNQSNIFEKLYTRFLLTIPNEYAFQSYLITRKNNRRVRCGFQRFPLPSVLPLETFSWRRNLLAGKSNLSCLRIDLHHFRFCIPRKTRTIGSTAPTVYSSSNEFHTFSNLYAASTKLFLVKNFRNTFNIILHSCHIITSTFRTFFPLSP